MLVTLSGMVTLVRARLKNAEFPMRVTGRPVMALGISTSPPRPVYPVIVIVPSLVT